ncbi:MAG: lipase [Magnetospirillum gryphiswaldense]|nr:lipase [Magnetospirillum gryphiswaldense]
MPPARFCFIGDSFVLGCGDPAMLGWVGRICADKATQGHDITVYNLGIRGQTSAEIASRWSAEARPRLDSLPISQRRLVFSFGANDAAQNRPPEETRTSTEAILDHAQSMAPTLLIGPAPIADTPSAESHLRDLTEMMAEVSRNRDIPFLPILSPLRQDTTWISEALANDGAHPGAGGYAALARLIGNWPPWQDWFS